MSFPNMQLRALLESTIAYAMAKGWKAAEVESTFDALMKPMREAEKKAEVERLSRELTLSQAEDALDRAMGEFWEPNVMLPFFEALRLRFPRHHKTIANIDDWAGDASNEREEDLASDEYVRLACKAINALKRLPWPKPVQVDREQG